MIVLLGFRVFRGFVLYAWKQIDVEDKQFMHRKSGYRCTPFIRRKSQLQGQDPRILHAASPTFIKDRIYIQKDKDFNISQHMH